MSSTELYPHQSLIKSFLEESSDSSKLRAAQILGNRMGKSTLMAELAKHVKPSEKQHIAIYDRIFLDGLK